MADDTTVKEPPPPPPPEPTAPPENIATRASKDIAKVKTGNDPFRPIRYTYKFIAGTIGEGLDTMALYGRKAGWIGLAIGIIAGIGSGSLVAVGAWAVIGVLAGAAVGLAKGTLTGGENAVGREYRRTTEAEDLVERKKIQTRALPNKNDYRAAYRRQQVRDSQITQQVLERTQENTRDFNTYWHDKPQSSTMYDRAEAPATNWAAREQAPNNSGTWADREQERQQQRQQEQDHQQENIRTANLWADQAHQAQRTWAEQAQQQQHYDHGLDR